MIIMLSSSTPASIMLNFSEDIGSAPLSNEQLTEWIKANFADCKHEVIRMSLS